MRATLSHYRVLEEIGKGGMGVVYRAHDERLDRDVALKVLPSGALADEAARKRFHKEALALSKLNHPNIATVFDFDTEDGTDFLVEELIEGMSLDEMLISGPLPEKEIVNLGAQLCEGLAAAHEHGVVHRDLKPGNVRVTPDARLKILDFGLAKMIYRASPIEPTASLTETQAVSGTLPYMAPEQLLNEKLDARTDIWAAGCVLYEMATGQRPFLGSGPALINTILNQPPAPPSKLNHKVALGLDAVILKCLEKDPALRYASARDIVVDLHRLTESSSTIRAVAQSRRARARNIVIASASLAVLVLAGIVASRFLPRPPGGKAPQPAPTTPSIAVLPFVNMSSDKEQEYFSDGLAEELLNDLAKIPELKVTARTSSFQFKGRNEDLRVIGEKLNVATVLEGSVRKQGNRVRITAQLIKVSDGYHLWSETYDRDVKDVFAVQEEIARSVAGSLKITLLGVRGPSFRPTNPEVYSAYLQGRYFQERATEQGLENAVTYYRRAIELDPTYAPAWAGLARTHSFLVGVWADTPLHEGFQKARQEAERALELDPTVAEAYVALGEIKRTYDWDWAGADATYRKALALEPGNAALVEGAACLAADLNQFEEALTLARRAVELDPLRASAYHLLAFHAWWAGRLDESSAAIQKALTLNPEYPWLHTVLSRNYIAESRLDEALTEAERETHPIFRLYALALAYHALARKQESNRALDELIAKGHGGAAFQIAEVYAFRGETDRAIEWLERSYAQRDGGLADVKGDPLFKSLEHDRRYAALLRRMGLPLN